jgi:hypothetical protein
VDTGILAPAVTGDERSCALRLDHKVTSAEIATWPLGTPEQWGNESHAIAVVPIYGKLGLIETLTIAVPI